MDKKLQEKDAALTDKTSPEALPPKQSGEEAAKARPAPRCPDNYSFEDGM